MGFKIRLEPSGHEFELEGKETILRAGLRSGLNLAHYCMNGSCGECYAKILEGSIEHCRHHDFKLSEQQKNDNVFLTCCCHPGSDLLLEMAEQSDAQQIPVQEIDAKIASVKPLSEQVMQLHVRTPRSKVLDFLAGQRTVINVHGQQLETGIASCPCDGMNLRFHIKKDDSELSSLIFNNNLKKNHPIKLTGPCGDFTLNEASSRDITFVAWETGFSQVQSMIDHAISVDEERHIQLFWLSSHDVGHYHLNYCRAWEDVLDHFSYVNFLVDPQKLSEAEPVMEVLVKQIATMKGFDVYSLLPESLSEIFSQQLKAAQFPMDQVLLRGLSV